jgi:hypothetical protein
LCAHKHWTDILYQQQSLVCFSTKLDEIETLIQALFVWLIGHQLAALFSQNKPATSNQPVVLFSQNKSAVATSHQPNEQTIEPPWDVKGRDGTDELPLATCMNACMHKFVTRHLVDEEMNCRPSARSLHK